MVVHAASEEGGVMAILHVTVTRNRTGCGALFIARFGAVRRTADPAAGDFGLHRSVPQRLFVLHRQHFRPARDVRLAAHRDHCRGYAGGQSGLRPGRLLADRQVQFPGPESAAFPHRPAVCRFARDLRPGLRAAVWSAGLVRRRAFATTAFKLSSRRPASSWPPSS